MPPIKTDLAVSGWQTPPLKRRHVLALGGLAVHGPDWRRPGAGALAVAPHHHHRALPARRLIRHGGVRAVAWMQSAIGKPVVVETRPGANGEFGALCHARSARRPHAEARDPRLPDVPTFEEQGQRGMVILSWLGFLAPARTSPAAVVALNAAFNRALADPAVRARLDEVGIALLGGLPERLGEHIRAEVGRWSRVVRANGLKPE